MLRPEDLRCFTKAQSVLPKVAVIYGIIAQARNVELSHVQRVMSMVLVDNICDQNVLKLQKNWGGGGSLHIFGNLTFKNKYSSQYANKHV